MRLITFKAELKVPYVHRFGGLTGIWHLDAVADVKLQSDHSRNGLAELSVQPLVGRIRLTSKHV